MRFTLTKVSDGEAKAVFNVFAESPTCTSVRTLPAHRNKDGTITQAFIVQMREAKRYERTEKPARDKPGWVYVLRTNDADSLWKIGSSRDPQSRRATFKTNFPVKNDYECLIETSDMYALERELHKLFASKRVAGTEFFNLDEHDLDYLRGLAA